MRVYWHDDALAHDTGAGMFDQPPSPLIEVPELHPENAERIRNIRAALRNGPIADRLEWHTGRHASRDELEMLHLPAYIDSVAGVLRRGRRLHHPVDAGGRPRHGTRRSPRPAPRSRPRPPCSTATATGPMRSCARRATTPSRTGPTATACSRTRRCAAELARRRGVARVAVLDWDVHHGNGTQECFWDRADVLAVSLHMRHGSWGPSHPQTGAPGEVGAGDGAGRNVNVELPVGTGDEGYRRAMARVVEPIVDAFGPELIVIACGQDASQFDPNGRMCVTMDGFRDLGAAARALADRHCDGRMVLVQEGGYGRTYSGHCMHATLEGVLGTGPLLATRWPTCPTTPTAPTPRSPPFGTRSTPGHWPL